MSSLQKDKDGYYKEEEIRKMTPRDFIKLMIKETCHQDVLNTVRIVSKEFQEKKE